MCAIPAPGTDDTTPSAGTTTAPSVVVAYRAKVGLATWRRRHAESPVPSDWPYGLDRLADYASPVITTDVPPLAGFKARLSALTGVRRPKAGPDTAEAAVAWEEMTAVDMLASVSARHYYAGVIWATDAIAAGEQTAQLKVVAKVLRQLDGLWVLSRPQADAVRDWLGAGCPPVHFLRFGVDPDFYFRRPYPTQPHVVSVGGDRDRDPRTLYAALAIVHAARPDAKITVHSKADLPVPDGIERFERLPYVEVSELLGTATVVALGTRPNLHASGMTVGLEGQAVGRPVVACRTPGMDDYFIDGVTAALVPPEDPDAMAAEIMALAGRPGPRRADGAGRLEERAGSPHHRHHGCGAGRDHCRPGHSGTIR